uniref:PH domain-containing protein n=1 Tax=Globisporangium ultimum (strain ATCC 200006 / CBS 805.95 / DAOM BR144) TaxID=431595 RepID=K3XB04_GLOUD
MQFLDQLSALEAEISSLLLFVRDAANAKSGVCKIDELLPPILRVVRVLNQHKRDQQLSVTAKVPISEHMQDLTRAMKDASAQSLLRIPVVAEGWVICAEWGTFWRNQRTEYACLCDDGILYFFTNEKRCAEYLFELARVRNGVISEPCKKNIKENAPKSQINFAKEGSDWSVRKGDTSMDTRRRHAFALFDARNKLRHILDVNTKVEADAWVTAISAELTHNQLCATLKSFFTPTDHTNTSQTNCATKTTPDPVRLRQCTGSLPQCAIFKSSQRVKFSLRWLHAQMERLKHGARQQRLKSINLNQAMKDFRRDSIQINGVVHPGTCMNQVFMALMATIRHYVLPSDIRRDVLKHGDSSKHKPLGSSYSIAAAEMVAMRLAKELLICSSRTNGGGDILDALHLVILSDHFCICPKAQTMEPIIVRLSSQPSASIGETFLVPVAEITIKMTYRIIPNDFCSNGSTNTDTVHAEQNFHDVLSDIENGNATRCQATTKIEPFDIVGTYHKKLIGNFHSWEELQGDVSIEFLPRQR